jgi:hypothetical protein
MTTLHIPHEGLRKPRGVRSGTRLALSVTLLCAPFAAFAAGQFANVAEHEAIAYSTSTPTDAIAHLQSKIDSGAVKLEFDTHHGYLPAVLKALQVPVSSQGLVFSRTSLQVDHIAPWTPRAVYFNDDVYVGWVQGGPIMEIASADPKLGAVFYTLEQRMADRPTFERQTRTCLACHDSSSSTGGVPGFLLRSVYPDRYGYAISTVREAATTDRSSLDQRWGGWYVTGTHGTQQHMGNLMAADLVHEVGNVQRYVAGVTLGPNGNVTDLHDRFSTAKYLTPHSDIVALLVLAHQTYVHNLITAASYSGRIDPQGVQTKTAAERLVRAMLFVKETPLTGAIQGTSGFADAFVASGPRDGRGRSLREFDLKHRLFRYPLSYLIYSQAFDAMPDVVKRTVYERLREVLTGDDASPEFSHLSASDRKAILEILDDTKPEVRGSTLPR